MKTVFLDEGMGNRGATGEMYFMAHCGRLVSASCTISAKLLADKTRFELARGLVLDIDFFNFFCHSYDKHFSFVCIGADLLEEWKSSRKSVFGSS